MLSLLRKIKSYFFKNLNSSAINNENITFGIIDGGKTHFTYKTNNLVYRNSPASSDFNVIKQIFVSEEYKSVMSYFLINNIEPKYIIDAGANIGLTTVYIKNIFNNVKITCVEPDESNYKLLTENLSPYIEDKSISLYKAGLMGVSGLNLSIGEDFRGGSDWAKQTILSNENSGLKSITIKDIMRDQNFPVIDLLKIDIEGAETFLLENETDLTFLEQTKIIAIEIHDEYNCREGIYALLGKHEFILIEDNETTIAINKKLIT